MNALDWGLAGAARLPAAALAMRTGPQLSTLIFHRVLPDTDPLFPNEVTAQRFDRMMAVVARSFRVMPLVQACQLLEQGRLPARALSITFDDGYADNEAIALPILKRHGLPASFFIATGFLDGGRMFNDTVIECLRHTRVDEIDLQGWGLGKLPASTVAQRRAAIGKILPHIKYLDLQTREAALEQLRAACGNPALSQTLMMQRAQVQSLHTAGMEIGAHTVNHPILTAVADTVAQEELRSGRDALQDLIQAPVTSLAYPNGRPDVDYDHRHVSMARALGFERAVSTSKGVCGPGADLFQLPRFTPWDAALPAWMTRLVMTLRDTQFKVALPAGAAQL